MSLATAEQLDSDPGLPLIERASYVKALREHLPQHVFERAPSRLVFMVVHLAIIVVATCAIAGGWVPWFIVPVLSLVIGFGFASMAFVSHELLHGGILRNKRVQYAIGWLGFMPFVLSPRLWIAWHNGIHHASANMPDDPDSYPTIEQYHANGGARFAVDKFSLGGRRWRGVLSLLFGFTGQSSVQLFTARSQQYMTPRQHNRAIAETLLGVATWATVGVLVGFVPFLFVFVLPLMVANTCVMAFILTNHSLNRRVDLNDPLASGLSVTNPRIVEFLTLGFGFHVEHHLFPAMSTRHAPTIRTLLRKHWPERYQSMSLREALLRLHRGGRVYTTATELYDPQTGEAHATL
jgi:fatty acid desaturase